MATTMSIDISTPVTFSSTSQGDYSGLNVDHNPTSVVVIIEGITLIIIFLGALVANLMAMITILRDKLLRRNLHNWLILNLIINDLGLPITSMLFSIISVFDNGNILVNNDVVCRINGTGAVIFAFGNFSTVVAITIDRYLGVVWSIRFPPSKTRTIIFIAIDWIVSITFIVITWIASFQNSLPPLFKVISNYKYNPDTHHCSPVWNACLYDIICFTTIFGVTVPVMMICYSSVVWTLRRQELQLRSFSKDNLSGTSRGVTTGSDAKIHISVDTRSDRYIQTKFSTEEVTKSADICKTVDADTSEPSNRGTFDMQEKEDEKGKEKVKKVKKVKKEKKKKKENPRVTQSNISTNKRVALTGILLVMTTVVCWVPYSIVHSCFIPIESSHWVGVAAMWLGYVNSLLDPLIYSFRNRRVRARYRAMFSRCPVIGCKSSQTG